MHVVPRFDLERARKAVRSPRSLVIFALLAFAPLSGCKRSESPEPAPAAPSAPPLSARFGRLTVGPPTLIPTGRLSSGLAVSPDGALAAVGTTSGVVLLVPLGAPANPVRTLVAHDQAVFEATFSPDGKRLATAGADNRLIVWDVATGRKDVDVVAHNGDVKALAFSPDGRRIATGSVDEDVRLWDAQTGKKLGYFAGHESSVYALLFSPDGKRLWSAGRDATVRAWNLETLQCSATSEKLEDTVVALRVVTVPSIDDPKTTETRLVGLGLTGVVTWFSPDDLTAMGTREFGTSRLNDVDLDAEGHLVVGEADGHVGVYWADPAKEGVATAPVPVAHDGATGSVIHAIRVIPKANDLLVLADSGLSRWKLPLTADSGHALSTLPAIDGGATELRLSADGKRYAVVSNGKVAVGPVADPMLAPAVLEVEGASAVAVTWAADGASVIVGDDAGGLVRFGLDGTVLAPRVRRHFDEVWYLVTAGDIVVSAGRDRRILRSKTATLEAVGQQLSEHNASIVALTVDAKGEQIASADSEGVTVVRRLSDSVIRWTKLGRNASGLAFSPDGQHLGMIEDEATITVFDLGSHASTRTFSGHTEHVAALAFHPSAAVLVTLDVAGDVRAWSLDDGSLLATVKTNSSHNDTLAFTPDGRLLAAASTPAGSVWTFTLGPPEGSPQAAPQGQPPVMPR